MPISRCIDQKWEKPGYEYWYTTRTGAAAGSSPYIRDPNNLTTALQNPEGLSARLKGPDALIALEEETDILF